MAERNTTFSGSHALGLIIVLDSSPGRLEFEALRLAVESALLPRVLVVLDAADVPAPLRLSIPKVLEGRDPHVGVLVVRDPLGSPYAAGVGGTALGVPRLSSTRSDAELRSEAIRAVVDALREPAVFQATWTSTGGGSWRAVSSVGLFRGVLGGYTRQATADQAGRIAELLEGQQLETIAGSTRYPDLEPELAGTAIPSPRSEGGEPDYESVIPVAHSEARRVYEQSYAAAATAHEAFSGLLGEKPRSWLPFMWSKWVTSLLRPWHQRMERAAEAARQIREARALQDQILGQADFSSGVNIAQVDAARRSGVEVMTLLPEKYDVVARLRDEIAAAFNEIRLLRAPLLAALNFREKARQSRPMSPAQARVKLAEHLNSLGIDRALELIETAREEYTPGSVKTQGLGLFGIKVPAGLLASVAEALVVTGTRRKLWGALKLAFGLAILAAVLLVATQVAARVIDVGWPALKVSWSNGRLNDFVAALLTFAYVTSAAFLPHALVVIAVFTLVRTLLTQGMAWVGSRIALLFRRALELVIVFGLLKVMGLVATEILGRTIWARLVPPLDRCPDLSLSGVPGELCRVGAEALDRILWFSPQGQQLGRYALQGLGTAAVLVFVGLAGLSFARSQWSNVLRRDGFVALASLPNQQTALGGNPLWAAWANIIYNDWHHASFRFHAAEIFAIAAQTVANWSRISARRLREIQHYLSARNEAGTALEEFHRPSFETVLDYVGRGGEYAGYVSGLNLFAADIALIGSRSMDLQWERMRGPARIGLPAEVSEHADEALQKYLAALASTNLLDRTVREAAPASQSDDGHARAILELQRDLRDAWGSAAVISTLNSQVFGSERRNGEDRIIQFIAPEEFQLLDTRETEPSVVRFAPRGAAEELGIDGLVATESFSSAGSIRVIPLIESSWIYADSGSKQSTKEKQNPIHRWIPRAGVVAEVLQSFGKVQGTERVIFEIPAADEDLIGGPAVAPEISPSGVTSESQQDAMVPQQDSSPSQVDVESATADANALVKSSIELDGASSAPVEPDAQTLEATAVASELAVENRSQSLVRRILGFVRRSLVRPNTDLHVERTQEPKKKVKRRRREVKTDRGVASKRQAKAAVRAGQSRAKPGGKDAIEPEA